MGFYWHLWFLTRNQLWKLNHCLEWIQSVSFETQIFQIAWLIFLSFCSIWTIMTNDRNIQRSAYKRSENSKIENERFYQAIRKMNHPLTRKTIAFLKDLFKQMGPMIGNTDLLCTIILRCHDSDDPYIRSRSCVAPCRSFDD